MPERLPFLRSQPVLRLIDFEAPWPHLHPDRFREALPGDASGTPGDAVPAGWTPIPRDALLAASLPDDDRPPIPLDRLCFVTDAGFGKSVNLEWLVSEINRRSVSSSAVDGQTSGSRQVAFLIHLGDRKVQVPKPQFLTEFLFDQLKNCRANDKLEPKPAAECLNRLRRQGRLTLAFDDLDQVDEHDQAVSTLRDLLADPNWRTCRFIVAGRPHAIGRTRDTLFSDDLMRNAPWQFLRFLGFSEEEATLYQGWTRDGRLRYRLLPPESREIAHTPRVAYYLRTKVKDEDFSKIHTRSDVYWLALNYMASEGLKNSKEARMLGAPAGSNTTLDLPECVSLALQLLGAMAFVMLTISPAGSRDGSSTVSLAKPNFNRLDDAEGIRLLKDAVYRRFLWLYQDGGGRPLFERDFGCLRAMNDALEQGIVDSHNLRPIIWRNPSLQEFLAAYWLSWGGTEEDHRALAERIYMPYDPATHDLYWVWRFAAEMPYDACRQKHWVRAMAPLYTAAEPDGPPPLRSCEMIHRSFEHMERLRQQKHAKATDTLDGFQGEFERIRRGDFGPQKQADAQDFVAHFKEVPAGSFTMGAPLEKQGMPEKEREEWRQMLAAVHAAGLTPEQLQAVVEEVVRSRYAATTRETTQWIGEELDWWLDVFVHQNVDAVEGRSYRKDETPAADCKTPEFRSPFLLNRYPTLNKWYRLFDPRHGEPHAEIYQRVSPTGDHPAIFVTWYDAWVFCRWAYWDGQACRLPHEDEWEYAAKAPEAGKDDDGRTRWWGDEDERLAEFCTFGQAFDKGSTTPPRDYDPLDPVYQDPTRKPLGNHRNPWDFIDMLGNVWEWTDDLYRKQYTRRPDAPVDSSARVLRGGSWYNVADGLRSAYRDLSHPAGTGNYSGFRVARALHRKP